MSAGWLLGTGVHLAVWLFLERPKTSAGGDRGRCRLRRTERYAQFDRRYNTPLKARRRRVVRWLFLFLSATSRVSPPGFPRAFSTFFSPLPFYSLPPPPLFLLHIPVRSAQRSRPRREPADLAESAGIFGGCRTRTAVSRPPAAFRDARSNKDLFRANIVLHHAPDSEDPESRDTWTLPERA